MALLGGVLQRRLPTGNVRPADLSYGLWINTTGSENIVTLYDGVNDIELGFAPETKIFTASGILGFDPVIYNIVNTVASETLVIPDDLTDGGMIQIMDGVGNAQDFPTTIARGIFTINGLNEDLILDVNWFDIKLVRNGNNIIINLGGVS